MKRFTNTVATLLLATAAVFTSCQENSADEIAATELATELDLSVEEIDNAIETMAITYSIEVLAEDDSVIEINNDEELEEYARNNSKPRIEFPIEITVDGETITVDNKQELKALIGTKKKSHRKPHFELVFPVTVTTDSGDLEIADKEAFKAYRETLAEDTRPAFVFPISIIINDETIVVNSEDELKDAIEAAKPEKDSKGHGERPSRPELVFPLSVNTEAGVVEIADEEAMKAYVETLEKGTHPDFVFPISVIIDEETIVINSEEELKALKPEKGHRNSKH
jgi:hypothetical protein